MYSSLQRLNAVFCYALVLAGGLVFLLALSSSWLGNDPTGAKLSHADLVGIRKVPRYASDEALGKFDLDVDLTPLFHWNTKQLFVWVSVTYTTKRNVRNEMVVWDAIVRTPAEAKFTLNDERWEYPMRDQGHGLRGRNVTYRLGWDVTPVAGLMAITEIGGGSFELPKKYTV